MISLILITTIIVTIIFFMNKEITIQEYLKTVLIVNIITLIIYSLSLIPFPNDSYFASGRVIKTVFYPKFIEEYQQAHTICTGSGKSSSCHTYYTTEHATHQQYWMAYDSLGQGVSISSVEHAQIKSYFGNNVHTSHPNRCSHGGHLDYGDRNIYTYNNDTNIYKYPTTKKISWFNPIKNSHSLFNENAGKYKRNYPTKTAKYETNRLQNKAGTDLNYHDFDILNTKLYEAKQANFIVAQENNFENCNKLEAYWNGGNYNDVVACISGNLNKPQNVKVFSYTSNEILKRDLETFILQNGITKKSSNGILNLIQKEYIQRDFSEFNYIKRDCPIWVIILAVVSSILSSFGCVKYFSENYDSRY